MAQKSRRRRKSSSDERSVRVAAWAGGWLTAAETRETSRPKKRLIHPGANLHVCRRLIKPESEAGTWPAVKKRQYVSTRDDVFFGLEALRRDGLAHRPISWVNRPECHWQCRRPSASSSLHAGGGTPVTRWLRLPLTSDRPGRQAGWLAGWRARKQGKAMTNKQAEVSICRRSREW